MHWLFYLFSCNKCGISDLIKSKFQFSVNLADRSVFIKFRLFRQMQHTVILTWSRTSGIQATCWRYVVCHRYAFQLSLPVHNHAALFHVAVFDCLRSVGRYLDEFVHRAVCSSRHTLPLYLPCMVKSVFCQCAICKCPPLMSHYTSNLVQKFGCIHYHTSSE